MLNPQKRFPSVQRSRHKSGNQGCLKLFLLLVIVGSVVGILYLWFNIVYNIYLDSLEPVVDIDTRIGNSLRGGITESGESEAEEQATSLLDEFITRDEQNMIQQYTSNTMKSVRRLQKSGVVKWGNGHENRLWLANIDGLSKQVIFKTNHIDMLFTDPSGNYDPKAPYYINNEYALLSFVVEYITYSIDRVLELNMIPITSLRSFTIDQFHAIFAPHIIEKDLDFYGALTADPISRSNIFRYTPPWYNGRLVEGVMIELMDGATRIKDTVCSTWCDNIRTDSRSIRVCVLPDNKFFPVAALSDMMVADYLMNIIDREVNCFVVPDTSPAGMAATVPGTNNGKAVLLKMIDNESAEFSPRTQREAKQKKSVLRYNRYRKPHGYNEKRMLRYHVDQANQSGSYTTRGCSFETSTISKYAKFWYKSKHYSGRSLGTVALDFIKESFATLIQSPSSSVLSNLIKFELQDVMLNVVDNRLDELMQHIVHCQEHNLVPSDYVI